MKNLGLKLFCTCATLLITPLVLIYAVCVSIVWSFKDLFRSGHFETYTCLYAVLFVFKYMWYIYGLQMKFADDEITDEQYLESISKFEDIEW